MEHSSESYKTKGVQLLLESYGVENVQSLVEIFILSRYFYKVGKPMITDLQYDELEASIVEFDLAPEYTSRTYDDDPLPFDILAKHGIVIPVEVNSPKADTSFLDEDKSFSIKKVSSVEETWQFFQAYPHAKKIVSLKKDGINIKADVKDSTLNLALTRGRSGNGIDVTKGLKLAFPDNKGLGSRYLLRGEAYVNSEYLEYLRTTYNSAIYASPKSAAISLLRRPEEHSKEDYKHLHWSVFSAEGLASTVHETYEILASSGFTVPPCKLLDSVPETYTEFLPWWQTILDDMYTIQKDLNIPADGLVLELDDYSCDSVIKNQYDFRQQAIKYSHWSAKHYKGIITKIIVEQRRVFCCCKVEIEPLRTEDGSQATVINTFNPSFLIDNGLFEGSEIEFERQSDAINVMINGKKIQIKEEGDICD